MMYLMVCLVLLLAVGGVGVGLYFNATKGLAKTKARFSQAENYFSNQQWKETIAAYEEALAMQRAAATSLSLLGFIPALNTAGQSLTHAADKAQTNMALAKRGAGDLEGAITLLRQKISAKQGRSTDYALLVETLALAGRLAEAEPLVEELREQARGLRDRLRSGGGNPDYYFACGLVMAGKGQLDEAVEQFRTLIELDKDYLPRLLAFSQLFLRPDASRMVWEFFGTLFERQMQLAKAQECFEHCLQTQPEDRALLERIAQLCHRSNRDQEALAWYDKLLRLKPDDTATIRKMLALMQQHNLIDGMLPLYEKLRDQDPHNLEDQKAMVKLYQSAKRPDDAVRVVSGMIDRAPGEVENYQLLADIYMRNGHSDKAILAYERLLKQQGGKPNITILQKVMPAIESLLKAAPDDQTALRLMMELRDKLKIDSAKYRYRLAKVKYEAGEPDEAFQLFQELWKSNSELKFKAGNMLGLCWLKRRSPDLALRHFQQMLGLDLEPELKREVAYHLGLTYEETNNWEEAHRVYGDILLTALDWRDVRERFEKAKAKIEEKRKTLQPVKTAGGGSTMLDLNITRYELKEELGRGGMGVVYRAHDTKLDRDVALKVLLTESADADEFTERLLREARAAANLNHPNIVAIYDVGDSGKFKHIAMELAEGGSVRGLMKKAGDSLLPPGEIKRLFTEFAEAMAYAHSKGIVHRDIKPENIMLDEAKHVKVTDFGLARMETSTTMTQPGMAMGTVQYMAPEQIRGEKPTPRVDIYASGCMLFEMLTGRVPFPGNDLASVIYNHVNTEPPALEGPNRINAGWQPIVKKMLAKDPAARYQTFLDVIADLLMLEVN